MAQSILETLLSSLDSQTLGSVASKLGASNDAVRTGLQGAAASILAALAGKASDTGFLGQLLGLINSPSLGSGLLSSLPSLIGGGGGAVGELGSKLLGMVFGSKQSAVAEAVGKAAGLSPSAGSGILSMAAPLLLGTLGQRVKSGGLGAAALGSLLSSEASSVTKFLPAGIGSLLGSLPSVGSMASAASHGASHGSSHGSHDHAESGGTNWLWPALALAALIGGALWFMSQPTASGPEVKHTAEKAVEKAADTAANATAAVSDAAKAAWAALGEFFKRKLPNGIEINIPRMGVENRLIDFIEDAAKPVDKTTWFDFDRLLFDTGKATLQPDSQAQLETVANILKAYPKVKLRIGGYTDNTGDKAANMKLSSDRANNVMAELVKLGVESSRLSAEGYGDQHPVADNSTEEGRAKNRRISMRVTEK